MHRVGKEVLTTLDTEGAEQTPVEYVSEKLWTKVGLRRRVKKKVLRWAPFCKNIRRLVMFRIVLTVGRL